MQPPDHGERKAEDPEIGNQVRDVGEVAHGDQIETFAGYGGIPELCYGSAFKGQDNGDGQNP